MTKVYVRRDDDGKIVTVNLYPMPDADPPVTTEMDTSDPEIIEYSQEQEKLKGRPINWPP